jgi:hypothetical protein
LALPLLASFAVNAAAKEKDEMPLRRGDLAECESQVVAKRDEKTAPAKIVDFVLAEVRKHLDPNPETEIVELKIDPDYRGVEGVYLVNVVLDAHGLKLMVGVMVSVAQTPHGMKATLGYID